MKLLLDTILKTITGEDMVQSETDKSPFLARDAIATALLADTDDNRKTKIQRYDLFVRVKTLKQDSFNAREIELMDEAVLAQYPTFFAGQVHYILNPPAEVTAEK
jgi:hypothetical protein